MTQPYDNEMRFALFKNDKAGNDKRPDYRGTAQVAGVEYRLSAWIRTSKSDGSKFMSGTIEPPRERPAAQPTTQPAGGAIPDDAADDVPF
jgi:uncharacterized protein (DUF736 family)